MVPIRNAILERILSESSSCLPSTSLITVKLTNGSLGNTVCSFSSSEEAEKALLSKEKASSKITKLAIVHHWGEIGENDTEIYSWSNQDKSLGNHEWKLYSSGYLTEHYYYAYEVDDHPIKFGKDPLTPRLAVSIIQEAEVGPIENLFECAVRKTDSIMKQRQKRWL